MSGETSALFCPLQSQAQKIEPWPYFALGCIISAHAAIGTLESRKVAHRFLCKMVSTGILKALIPHLLYGR